MALVALASLKQTPMSEADIPQFINEVKKRESIWNSSNQSYSNRYYVLKSWKELSEKFSIPEAAIKAKWKNLRDLFRRELKRYDAERNVYSGRWRFFYNMWFTYDNSQRIPPPKRYEDEKKKRGEVADTEGEKEEEDIEDAGNDDADDDDNENPLQFEHHVKCELQEQGDEHYEEVFLNERLLSETPTKKRKLADADYDMMYLKSLAPYFKHLEPMRKLVVRSKIQDIFLNELAAQSSANKANDKRNS